MILVVGGAGYIGSQTNKELSSHGHKTVVFDSFVSGHRDFVRWGALAEGDLASVDRLREVFKAYRIDAVMHFASYINVHESVLAPDMYYKNNVANTFNLLDVMKESGCRRLIFSSTSAVYGTPIRLPVTEDHPRAPINPYGDTKLIIERALADYERAYGIRHVLLRYFNAAGADEEALTGEHHRPETHLIPLAMQTASGMRDSVSIFGTNYPTPDGTCIRDYIHVADIAQAHTLSLDYLMQGGRSEAFNIGVGRGYSVRDVLRAVGEVSRREIRAIDAPRREGDPVELVGDPGKIMRSLGWSPRYTDIKDIVRTAWNWHTSRFGALR